ncbi:diacylglycerol kinase family enzyme [Halopolyspora algeriensis]|uniref:Diacylglycerol kinase family enzyme n=1 Tax=Halopolyspora algeriensis TaxID=1500506 RepID=A0A368W0C0_9ACTN|nr:diacylglycerol kinase family protein [Halopolyspora algeriensis]RCW45354.1 diacylglycerol kinase family enzyme [Halopolyspora algeriensis]TQM47394.1 diacylglycerol kinase family enzyme [Halopolyspora algeriensis]
MRAILIVNPRATSTTVAGRNVLAHALANEVKLECIETRYRGHAADTARQAVIDAVDVIIVHGGDGTVNEVVNGMLSDDLPRTGPVPSLAVVPGGSANVFAGALGLPRDPVEATHRLLHALATDRRRRIGLGRANGHWFTFNAGIGWDAEVVAEVERLRSKGRDVTPVLYARTALARYVRICLRVPALTAQADGDAPVRGLHTAFISNTNPWTYLGSRPVQANPETTFDTGLGVFALRSMNAYSVLRHVAQMLRSRAKPHGKTLFRRANVGYLHVSCAKSLRLQVDGDTLGEYSAVEFVSVPNALRVVV